MLRRVVSAFVVMGLCVGLALADEFRANIFKIEGNKVTFAKMKKGEKGEEKTLPVARDVKVMKSKYDKTNKTWEKIADIDEGIKHKMFSDIDSEKGISAFIVTNDDNTKITEIRILPKRKKKNQ